MSIVSFTGTKQGSQRVVARDQEASEIGQELATEVEDDEKEVEGGHANDSIDLRDRGLLLDVVEGGIFRKLDNCLCQS